MPDFCCVIGCANEGGTVDDNGKKISFHSIPAIVNRDDERMVTTERRNAWIVAIKRDDWTPTKYSKVCSVHFHKGKHEQNF